MNFLYLIQRFDSLFDTYMPGRNTLTKALCILDWTKDYILYGASLNDYFAFGFYKMRPSGKNEYITYRRYHWILDKCNDKEKICLFRDKSKFNERFSDFLHREYIDLNSADEQEFCDFFGKHSEIFVKEVLGFRGKSVYMYSKKDTDASELYAELKSETGCHYIAESRLVEDESLAAFHPNSVNTIRIVTVYDDKADILHFMFAKFRMGNNGACMDNTHAGGISGDIDLESGVIKTVGYSVKSKDTFICHPATGKQIVGFRIPFWQECKAFIEKAARVVPEVRYVGWDVVLMPGGEFALIEANDNADHDGQQLKNKGMWKEYEAIISKLR